MSDDTKTPKILPPEPHRAADLGRAAARALAGAIPVAGSAATELVNMFPDPTADRRKQWERDVSDGVNDLSGKVSEIDERTGTRQVTITGAAAAAAMHMVKSCPDGLAQQWTSIEDLVEAFPDLKRDELLDGLGDLENYGLVKSIGFIGSPPRYQLEVEAYPAIDPAVMGWDPNEDARTLAREALATRDTVSVPALDEKLAWPRRRFNPALRIVVGFVGDGRVSRTIQPKYVTMHFAPNNAERSALRAFSS